MAKTQIVIGIDIGTDTIKILAVKKDLETGKILETFFLNKIIPIHHKTLSKQE